MKKHNLYAIDLVVNTFEAFTKQRNIILFDETCVNRINIFYNINKVDESLVKHISKSNGNHITLFQNIYETPPTEYIYLLQSENLIVDTVDYSKSTGYAKLIIDLLEDGRSGGIYCNTEIDNTLNLESVKKIHLNKTALNEFKEYKSEYHSIKFTKK